MLHAAEAAQCNWIQGGILNKIHKANSGRQHKILWSLNKICASVIIVCMCVCVLVTQSCPTLCNPMDCTLPGSSVHGILQARILEWAAISFSKGPYWPRDWTLVSLIADRFFTIWATREAHHMLISWVFCLFWLFLVQHSISLYSQNWIRSFKPHTIFFVITKIISFPDFQQ